jgi:ferritin
MKYITESKEWQSPSFLVWLLREQVKELESFTKGITEKEFDQLCTSDKVFQKNLELEMRDMKTVITHLYTILNS